MNKLTHKIFGRKNGFGMVQAMMLAVLVATLGLVVAQMSQRLKQSSKHLNASGQAKFTQEMMSGIVQSDSVWKETRATPFSAASPVNLDMCLSFPGKPECPKLPDHELSQDEINALTENDVKPLKVVGADGTVFYDHNNPESGFTVEGKPCASYVSNSAACPFRMKYSFGFACDPSNVNCKDPIIIHGDLELGTYAKSLNINPERYKIRERLKTETDFLKSSCESLNGTFDVVKNECTCPNSDGIISLGCKTITQYSGCTDGTNGTKKQEIRFNNGNIECIDI